MIKQTSPAPITTHREDTMNDGVRVLTLGLSPMKQMWPRASILSSLSLRPREEDMMMTEKVFGWFVFWVSGLKLRVTVVDGVLKDLFGERD